MSKGEYLFYILRNLYELHPSKKDLPVIYKLDKSKYDFTIKGADHSVIEGPFYSIYELKKNSRILSNVKLQKHKDRILNSKNVKEINELIFTKDDESFEKQFILVFSHIYIGMISNKKVKGVHFYNPENIKILEIIDSNENGVYSARIEKLNKKTGDWIEKDEVTTFFPDSWSVNELFHECYYAYTNRVPDTGNVYKSTTKNGIKVKLIINDENKLLTIYPVLDES